MKKVLLIGDSIRKGYDKYVKLALEDSADVRYPEENCRFSQYVLHHFIDWLRKADFDGEPDLIHLNVGLWDCAILFDEECLTPPDIYERFMDRICVRIRRLCPNAKVIIATSTPVIEAGFPNPQNFKRYNRDIDALNEIAVRVAQRHGFMVNDLHALLANVPESFHSDATHFYTKEATKLITAQVTDHICRALGITARELDYDAVYGQVKDFIGF